MTVHGTLKNGFNAQCGECDEWFDKGAFETAQKCAEAITAAGWQVFPCVCDGCVKKLHVWMGGGTRDHQESVVHKRETSRPATKKDPGNDSGKRKRRVRRLL